jgi:WD40 repeat protein
MFARVAVCLFPLLAAVPASAAEEPLVPPADGKPVLQLDAGGPMAAVTALAFSPDGKTLYVGGYDKVVRVWAWDPAAKKFVARGAYQIPIGPGMYGLINALAVSPDGNLLAVAGSGAVRGVAGFGDTGLIVPVAGYTPAMELDSGAIYVFDLTKDKDAVKPLRAHRGPVTRLTFLPAAKGKPPLLVSAGREGENAYALRLWDAAAGALLAERGGLADPDGAGTEPPGLAAWYTGPGAEDVGVALALAGVKSDPPPPAPADGVLHYWDVGNNENNKSVNIKDRYFSNCAAFRPRANRPYEGVLFTADRPAKAKPAGAFLHGWPVAAKGKGPQEDPDRDALLSQGAIPKTLTLLPAPDGGVADLAAAVLFFLPKKDAPKDAPPPPLRLILAGRSDDGGYGDLKASADLWVGLGRPPVTAASPDGAWLAVAGAPDHSVWLYAVADLLKKKTNPAQTIAAAGAPAREVGFVRNKAGGPGLRLKDGAGADWVLDLDASALQKGRGGWTDDNASPGNLEVSKDGLSVTVREGGKEVGTVNLMTGKKPSARPRLTCDPALLPAGKPLGRALLAVAYLEDGVSYLELFDVKADRPVRRLTSHVDALHHLAFRADGRLLASAGDDQSVAVWSLTDLDTVVRKGGAIPGLVVAQKGGKVVVSELTDALSVDNKKALADKKDVAVEGVVVKDEVPRPFKTPQDFYDAAWEVKPDDRVVLKVGGADVRLTTDQGEDERKPLFSFFMKDEAKDRLWLAWTPTGPYDTPDRVRAEGVIGWHSNTGKESAPAEFAPAAQYRNESYRPGLLKFLVAEGNLSGALKKWDDAPAPKPEMGLRLEAPKTGFPRDARGCVLMEGAPPKYMQLRTDLSGILPAKVKRVRWRFDDGEWRDFDRQSDLAFSVDLDKEGLTWKGRDHEFGVLVETLEANPREYSRPLPVLRVASRPRITSDLADDVKTKKPAFAFAAQVTPGKYGDDDAKARVTVRLNNDAPKEVGAKIDETFTLAPGDNVIEVRAENEGAPGEFVGAVTRSWKVYYEREKVAAPTIFLGSVSSASKKPQDGETLVVHSPRVRVFGRITSPQPVEKAECDGAALDPGADKRDFPIDEAVTLEEVGAEQKVVFTARNADGGLTKKTLVLKYEPPAPQFEFDANAPGPVVAGDAAQVELRGQVIKAEHDDSKVEAKVRLNGKPVDGVELKDGRLTAKLAPQRGDNTVEVVLSNRFDTRTETARCYRRRPPEVKKLEAQPGAGPLLAELTATVESPADRPLSGVRVFRGDDADLAVLVRMKQEGDDKGGVKTWKVNVTGVLVKAGPNALSLVARNEDGESPKASANFTGKAPTVEEPEVELLEPRLREFPVEEPKARLAFRVRWHGPAGKVVVLVNDVERDARLEASPDGKQAERYETDSLPLQGGPNVVRVRAANDAGKAVSEPFTVFYRRHTAVVRLTGLSAGKRTAPPVAPQGHGSQVTFPEQSASSVWVHGEVEWPDDTDPILTKVDPAPRVRVWVNDFEQFEAMLGPPKGCVRGFTAELRLNTKINRVEIGSSDVKAEKATFAVGCSEPARDQRLHVLPVAPGARDAAKVTGEVLAAFQAREVEGDSFKTPAFAKGRVYGPVIKLAQREAVFDALEIMKGAIGGEEGDLNDVIVVLFQGEQLAAADQHFLLTGETKRRLPGLKPGAKVDEEMLATLKESALTCDDFREKLADVRGAKVVLLDARDPLGGKETGDRVRELLDKSGAKFPKIGCLDYVLLGGDNPKAAVGLVSQLQRSLDRPSSLGDLAKKEAEWSAEADRLFRCFVPEGLLSINLGPAEK